MSVSEDSMTTPIRGDQPPVGRLLVGAQRPLENRVDLLSASGRSITRRIPGGVGKHHLLLEVVEAGVLQTIDLNDAVARLQIGPPGRLARLGVATTHGTYGTPMQMASSAKQVGEDDVHHHAAEIMAIRCGTLLAG